MNPEIPYINHLNLSEEMLGEGYRFVTEDERGNPPKDIQYFDSSHGWINRPYYYSALSLHDSYRTREPLPEKYREPDYTDPAYRAKVEEAHKQGLRIQQRHPDFHGKQSWHEINCYGCNFGWDIGWQHRIHPEDEAKYVEPPKEPDLSEYQTDENWAKVFMAWRSGHELERFFMGKWGHFSFEDFKDWRNIIRIKPTPPPAKTVPLDDYKVGEAVLWQNVLYVVTNDGGANVTLDGGLGALTSILVSKENLMKSGMIHRNGSWQKCEKTEGALA